MKERYNFTMKPETHETLKEGAKKLGQPMGIILEQLIKRYLNRLIKWSKS